MKVLLNSFQLNGHTLGFNSQISTLQPPCEELQTVQQDWHTTRIA